MDSVVLLSGGLDSAVCLHRELDAGRETCALAIDYGQTHRIELERASRIAALAGVPFEVARLRIDLGASLISGGGTSPVLPCRNMVLASVAAAAAQRLGASRVVMGACADDHDAFPDCRPAFLSALSRATALAVGVDLFAPLSGSPKSDAIRWARSRPKVMEALALSWSCYTPSSRKPCGACLACVTRRDAFAEAGVVDPAAR